MTTVPTTENAENRMMTLARRAWRGISVPLVAVLLGLLIGAILLLASGSNPIEAYGALLKGAFGTPVAVQRTLEKATPLIFSGLAVGSLARPAYRLGVPGSTLMSCRCENTHGKFASCGMCNSLSGSDKSLIHSAKGAPRNS